MTLRHCPQIRHDVAWALAHLQSLRTSLIFEDPRKHTSWSAEMGFSVVDLTRIDKSAARGAVVEAPDLFWRAGINKRFHRGKRFEPLPFQRLEVDGFDKVWSCEVFSSNPPPPSQKLEEGKRGKTGVLATGRPAQRAEHQKPAVKVERIKDIAGFVASGERENLVDGKVNRMKRVSDPGVAHSGNKSPGRVAGPLDLGRVPVLSNDGTNKTRLIQINIDGVSTGIEQPLVGGKGLGDPGLRALEIAEIAAEPVGIRLDQNRGPAGEVGVEGPVLGEQPCQALLVVG